MAVKTKSIDLGALQDAFQMAKKLTETDRKNLLKSQEAYDRSKKALQSAEEALKSAASTVLNA